MFGVTKLRWTRSPPTQLDEAPGSNTSILAGVGLTAAAWVTCRFVLGMLWSPARNIFQFQTSLWVRSDSINYLSIARRGMTFGICGSPGFPENSITRFVHAKWCGTALWMPGYPVIGHGIHVLGIPLRDGLLVLSWLCVAAFLFVIWYGWCRELTPGRSYVVLLAVGLFPGAIYSYAIYPISLTLLCIAGAILAVMKRRFLVGMILLTVAGMCYPVAWFAAAGVGVGMIIVDRTTAPREIARRALYGAGGIIIPLGIIFLSEQLLFGHWNAYFLEAEVGKMSSAFDPLSRVWELVVERNTLQQTFMGPRYAWVLAAQGVLAIVLILGALGASGYAWLKRRVDPASFYPAMVGLFVLGSIISSTADSGWNRSIALAAPSVLFLRKRPLPVLVASAVVIAGVSAVISITFFRGTMV